MKKVTSPEYDFGARLGLAFHKQAAGAAPANFTRPTGPAAPSPAASPSSASGGLSRPPQGPKPPAQPAKPADPTLWNKMTANAGRTWRGAWGTPIGGLATAGTGAVSSAAKTWNALTPKSMNTSPEWQQGTEDVFNTAVNFTNESARDLVGGLGGDQDYFKTRSQDAMAEGWNAPGVTPGVRTVAQIGATTGNIAADMAGSAAGMRMLPGATLATPQAAQAATAGTRSLPQTALKGLSYVTGQPLTPQVNTLGMMGSQIGQTGLAAMANRVDTGNAEQGYSTNYTSLVPMVAADNALRGVVGDTGADLIHSALGARQFAGSINPTALTGGQGGSIATQLAASGALSAPADSGAPAQGDIAPLQPPEPTQQAGDTPNVDAMTYADPADRANLYSSAFKLSETAPPEAKAQVDAGMQALKSSIPEDQLPTVRSAIQDPSGPEAQPIVQKGLQNAINEAQNDPAKPPPQNLTDYGNFMSGVVENFQKMDPMAQLALGLGLTMGLVGLISSFGEEGGGMGGFLMTALGLGAAGMGAAGGGMFGQQGQDFVGNMVGSIGQATGMIPQSLTPEQKALLTAKDPVAAAMAQSGNLSRAEAAQKVQEARAQLDQLKTLNSLGGMRGSIMQRMGLTPEEAQQASQNVGTLSAQYADPESPLNKKLQEAEWYSQQNNMAGAAMEAVGPQRLQSVKNWWTGKQSSVDMGIARRIYMRRVALQR